jgi:hypothetical protein
MGLVIAIFNYTKHLKSVDFLFCYFVFFNIYLYDDLYYNL